MYYQIFAHDGHDHTAEMAQTVTSFNFLVAGIALLAVLISVVIFVILKKKKS